MIIFSTDFNNLKFQCYHLSKMDLFTLRYLPTTCLLNVRQHKQTWFNLQIKMYDKRFLSDKYVNEATIPTTHVTISRETFHAQWLLLKVAPPVILNCKRKNEIIMMDTSNWMCIDASVCDSRSGNDRRHTSSLCVKCRFVITFDREHRKSVISRGNKRVQVKFK